MSLSRRCAVCRKENLGQKLRCSIFWPPGVEGGGGQRGKGVPEVEGKEPPRGRRGKQEILPHGRRWGLSRSQLKCLWGRVGYQHWC